MNRALRCALLSVAVWVSLIVVSGVVHAALPATIGKTFILHNGAIFTADSKQPYADAVGVRDGRIVAVGSEADVFATMEDGTQRIDLQGRFLMPGLVDSHAHVGFAGFQLATASFPKALKSAAELQAFAQDSLKMKEAWLDDVLLFMNVSLAYWEQVPMLDAVFNSGTFTDIPVILAGSDAHTGWCNKAMLKRAGLSAESVAALPVTVRDSFGQHTDTSFNGFASEGAWDEVLKHAPPVSEATMTQSLQAGAKVMHSYGFTAWMEPIANIRPLAPIFDAAPTRKDTGLLPAYVRMLQENQLQARVSALLLVKLDSDPSLIQDVLDVKNRFAPQKTEKDSNGLNIIGIKLLQDGVLEYPSQTAKLTKAYEGRADYDGPRNIETTRYKQLVAAADAAGLAVHVHAIGDRAVQEALEAIAFARQTNANSTTLHSMTHLQIVQPADIKRFQDLNVACSMQFLWSGNNVATTALVEGSVPAPLLQSLYPAQSLLSGGAVVAAASDWPVSTPNPFPALYTAVTRQGPLGLLPPASEVLSRNDALRAYSINAAKVIGRDSDIGSITPGKQADFALFDRNLASIPAQDILDAKVLWTMFGGTVVYQADSDTK